MTRLLLLAAFSIGSTAWAQTTTGTTTGTTGGTTGGGPAGASTLPSAGGFTASTFEASPNVTGGGSSGANVNSSNIFASFYANPYYSGRPGSLGQDAPGGFGTPLAGGAGSTSRTTGRTGTGTTGRTTAGTTGTTGRTTAGTAGSTGANITGTQAGQGFGSGFGGTTGGGTTGFGSTGFGTTGTTGFGTTGRTQTGRGTTGFGGTTGNTNTQQQGVVAPQSRAVAYSVVARFPTRPIAPAAMTTDLTGALTRSTYLSNPGAINLNYDGKVVVLRGQVKDEEEARTAEGIVRLTPGVRAVKNELTYPKQ